MRFKEIKTGFIYEAEILDDAVLVRQMGLTAVPEMLSYEEFEGRFDECHTQDFYY